MYTRPYTDESGIMIPESYNGTALRESTDIPTEEHENTAPVGAEPQKGKNPWEDECEKTSKCTDDNDSPSFFSKLNLGGFFNGIFKNGKFSLQKIGTEEILLLAAAAFLFFSKDGDKECAVMLLILLFI